MLIAPARRAGRRPMRVARGGWLALAAVALAMAVTGRAGAAEDWKTVEAAALKEGEVVLYHNFAPAGAEQVVAAFNKDHPKIRVAEVRLASAAFYQRFGAEYGGGRSEADACSSAWDDQLEEWAGKGWIAEWSPP